MQQRTWPLAAWRERYLNHPLVGTLARRLIWRFTAEGTQQVGIWHAGQVVGVDGQPLAGLGDTTTVNLWHPLDSTAEEVLAWRAWLSPTRCSSPSSRPIARSTCSPMPSGPPGSTRTASPPISSASTSSTPSAPPAPGRTSYG
ncbi:DUF4132 domain-containing protein [Oscillochloris sp. ZM17-4]|nr:DUF4132 domain-containing protein [Oscillochloris sp. ZM17-4]